MKRKRRNYYSAIYIDKEMIDTSLIAKTQKRIFEDLIEQTKKPGLSVYSEHGDKRKKWLEKINISDTYQPESDKVIEEMIQYIGEKDVDINYLKEVRQELRQESKKIINAFKRNILEFIKNYNKQELSYEAQFSMLIEMIFSIRPDAILSKKVSSHNNLLYGSYLLFYGGINNMSIFLATSLIYQALLTGILFKYASLYGLMQSSESPYHEGTLIPDNIIDVARTVISTYDIEPIISSILLRASSLPSNLKKVDNMLVYISSVIESESYAYEVDLKARAYTTLFYLLYLSVVSGVIAKFICTSIQESDKVYKYLKANGLYSSLRTLNTYSLSSRNINQAINVVINNYVEKEKAPEEWRRILDGVEEDVFGYYMSFYQDAIIKAHKEYELAGVVHIPRMLKNYSEYKNLINQLSSDSWTLAEEADYKNLIDVINDLINNQSSNLGMFQVVFSYEIPIINFDHNMPVLDNPYMPISYILNMANLEFHLNVDITKKLPF